MKMLTISDEKNIEELVSQISDRIRMLDYSKEQLLVLIEDYVKRNLLDMKYHPPWEIFTEVHMMIIRIRMTERKQAGQNKENMKETIKRLMISG